MKFDRKNKVTVKEIDNCQLNDRKCHNCNSKKVIIRSSYIREIQDMGSPSEQILIKLKMNNFLCKECGFKYTPEHPDFPSKFEYSQSIIEYCLIRNHYNNISGNEISRDLKVLHNVTVPEATVYTWLKLYTPEFLKARITEDKNTIPPNIKSITVDGTYFDTTEDIIGKKKDVESLSVTKLKDSRCLLTWWE